MIAQWFVLSLILRVMESPMTRVFNLSELMVGSFGVSDPVTGRVETREGSASHSLLNGENRLKVSVGWAFLQHFPPETVRKLSGCGDLARGFILTLVSVLTGGKDTVSSFPTLKWPLPNDCVWSWACNTAIFAVRRSFSCILWVQWLQWQGD